MTTFIEEVEQAEAAEIHLNTGTILAIFFAAALISAVFFGLGYSFGVGGKWKSSTASVAQQPMNAGTGMASQVKPVAGSGFANGVVPAAYVKPVSQTSEHGAARESAATLRTKAPASVAASAPRHVAPAPAPSEKAASSTRMSAREASAKTLTNGAFMVQVGAIGNRKDARLLVTALRHDGFHAGIYPGAHDKFLHVQIGPFRTREQAQAMRHKVAASGYHAMLKHAT